MRREEVRQHLSRQCVKIKLRQGLLICLLQVGVTLSSSVLWQSLVAWYDLQKSNPGIADWLNECHNRFQPHLNERQYTATLEKEQGSHKIGSCILMQESQGSANLGATQARKRGLSPRDDLKAVRADCKEAFLSWFEESACLEGLARGLSMRIDEAKTAAEVESIMESGRQQKTVLKLMQQAAGAERAADSVGQAPLSKFLPSWSGQGPGRGELHQVES